jgi:ammonia channel protein AmtB
MPTFPEQVTTANMLVTFINTLGAVAVLLVVLGLALMDMGLVRRRNVLDTMIQKISAAMIGGLGTLICGYAIWQWQFNTAFGVPHPLRQAFKDWWIGGQFVANTAITIDPKVLPEADVLQIFLVFFVTFTMATMALIHTGVVERIKALPLYIMSLVIGLVLSPLVGYLCWGSLSPLTNRGTHDFDGIFPLYIFAGTWVLVLAWRVGPRLGAIRDHESGIKPVPHNLGLVGAGVLLILFALPFITIGSGYVIPGTGYFGVSMTQSGLGMVIMNLFAALLGGGTVGTIIAYRRREANWALLGPIAGVVMGGTLFDIGNPVKCLIVGALGPIVSLGTAALLRRVRIDEPKVIPLALGPGVAGALLTGFLQWGTKTGGYPGLKGEYALGHATITPWWQLAGIVATMLVAGVPCLIMCLFFERFGGLRVTEEAEIAGLDASNWNMHNFGDDLEPPVVAIPGARTGPTADNVPAGRR